MVGLAKMSDPYEILGVARDSGPAEWKRAYRRLAMRWHPDRNPDPHATERFKQIGAAYEQLLAVDTAEAPESEANASDHAETPTEAAPEEPSAPKAADIRRNLELDLEAAASGCQQTVHYTRGKACANCDGTGEAGIARTRFCSACHGSGRVHDADRTLIPCVECVGRGLFTERICPACGGEGREITEVSLEITVPPGMLPGDELRLAGQGEAGDDARLPGDLYLTVILRSHRLFELRGRDLCYRMPASALAMLAGGEVVLPTLLKGQRNCKLEVGPAELRTLRLAGLGYPGRGKSPAGDLVVELTPVFPVQLNARQRKALLQANAALLDDLETAFPEIAAWQRERLDPSGD